MSLINYPIDICLAIFSFISTKDLFPLSLTCKQLHDIAEYERKRRQNIDNLLSIFVHDVDAFRLQMRKTGGIIIGNFASVFFTECHPRKEIGNAIQLFFHNFDFEYCLKSWLAFMIGECELSDDSCSVITYKNGQVRSLPHLRGHEHFKLIKFKIVEFRNRRHRFILEFREKFWISDEINWDTSEYCFFDNVCGPYDCKYISWDTAVWVQPHAEGNVENRKRYKWTVDLTPLKREDDDPAQVSTSELDEKFKSYFEGLIDTVHYRLGAGDDKQIVTITNFKIN
jgi:F-box-like